jgi:hypothetical protein
MEGLLFVGLAAVLGVIALGYRRWHHRRAESLQQLCLERGWRYLPSDPGIVDGLALSFPLFAAGDPPRDFDHVVVARQGGTAVTLGDYSHREWSTDSEGRSTRTTSRHAVAVVALPGRLPALRLAKEGALTRIGGALGLRDVEVGWAPFDRRFRVKGASEDVLPLLHAAMTELLVAQPYDSWEISGRRLLIARRGRWRREEYEAICELADQFVRLVPSTLWSERAAEGTAGH